MNNSANPIGRYSSNAAAKKNWQRIWYEYRDGRAITGIDAEDVADILNNHPEKDRIIGPGVAYFCVRLNSYKQPGFVAVWHDGSEHPFSVKIAAAGKIPSAEYQQIEALQEEAWNEQYFSGLPRMRASREQMLSFIADETLADWAIKSTGHGTTGLVDRKLAERWIEYYRARCKPAT